MALLLFLTASLLGCGGGARGNLGTQCELNSQCAAPLVCRLGFCRNECATARDCAAGEACMLDGDGLGACELPAVDRCATDGECQSPLVCRGGRCVNECASEGSTRDCPAGALCRRIDGALGCVDEAATRCEQHSDCASLGVEFVCADDGACREECHFDRDCRFGRICCERFCDVASSPRCGGVDAGPVDGGVDAAGQDAGPACGTDRGRVRTLVVGYQTACAVLLSGEAYCWGANLAGQLGRGFRSMAGEPTPAPIMLTGVVDMALGIEHSCALRTGGEVRCFGNGRQGELGDGLRSDSTSPVLAIAAPGNVIRMESWLHYTCVSRVPPDKPACWGLFRAASDPVLDVPTTESLLPVGTVGLGVGEAHVCGLADTFAFTCIGDDFSGELGDGPGGPAITDGVEIAGAHHHSCLLRAGGEVVCWGENDRGQLGNGTTTDAFAPVPVTGLRSAATSIAVGEDHSCAVLDDCTLWCWGSGDSGALADPTGIDRSRPIAVTGVGEAILVGAGRDFTCVLSHGGEIHCFGANLEGQLGRGVLTESSPVPAPVTLP